MTKVTVAPPVVSALLGVTADRYDALYLYVACCIMSMAAPAIENPSGNVPSSPVGLVGLVTVTIDLDAVEFKG
jgi:hypothetical protein